MPVPELICWSIGMLYIGWLAGTCKRECDLYKLCRKQQDRGDHWFERYVQEVKDGREPLPKDF